MTGFVVPRIVSSPFTLNLSPSFAIAPSNPQVLYAGDTVQALFSTDAGTTWHPVGNGLPPGRVTALAVSPTSATTVYAGTDAGVFVSTDGRASWSPMNEGLNTTTISALAVASDGSRIYAAIDSGGVAEFELA